jgi:hypothetical protein
MALDLLERALQPHSLSFDKGAHIVQESILHDSHR